MKLKDFEKHISGAILRRGYGYYEDGNVVSLVRNGAKWVAKVEGTDDYTVTVALTDDGEITASGCDCPYDMGPYCKHEAAVFYALRDESANAVKKTTETIRDGQSGPKKREKSLGDVLQNMDKPDLIAVILELAGRDARIKDALLLNFSEKENMTEHARRLIRSSVKSVMRRGFVEYGDVYRATDGAEKALELADRLREGGDILGCVRLCVIVAEEMMDLLDNCDDSNGAAGGMVDSAIGLLDESTYELPQDSPDAGEIFHVIISHADSKIYNSWSDWKFSLISACIPLCGDPKLRDELEEYCMRIRIQGSKSEWDNRYANKSIQRIAFDIISRFDGPERAALFIEQNLENSDFRKMAIEKALLNSPERALALCLEGERLDAQYAGLVSQWKKYRYKAYELQNDGSGQKELAAEFVKGGEFDYFPKLKALYSPDEWGGIIERLLNDLEASGNVHRAYVDIIVNEGLKPRILQYTRKYAHTLTRLYPHLIPEYKKDVGEMFEKLILEQAERASGRNDYKDVCGVIKHYAKACGKQPTDAIKKTLAANYPRRPAFIDELNKI